VPRSPSSLDEVADEYVKLALALGAHDPEYVDAYFGPVEWRRETATARWTLEDIQRRAQCLLADLGDAVAPALPGSLRVATIRASTRLGTAAG